MQGILTDKSIVIASYTHIVKGEYTTLGGPALSIKEYLVLRARRLLCIWQPVPISDDISAIAEFYESARQIKRKKLYVPDWPFGRKKVISFIYIALKLRDIVSVFYFVLFCGWKFDIFLGVEAIDASVGVILRRLGRVKKVVYYNLDYGKQRFAGRFLNAAFHSLDKFAVFHADYTWCLSATMTKAREELGISSKKTSPQSVVPIGVYFNKIKRLKIEELDRKAIVYLGLLDRIQGVQLIIESLPDLLKKDPQARLVVIGTGPFENQLKEMAKERSLGATVSFTGLISDREVEELLCKCAIGVAPYLDIPNSTKRFTDPTKPKMYVACGLPVIVTKVSPIAADIEASRAGFAINYDRQELVGRLFKLLNDDSLYRQCRDNAIKLAATYNWDDILDKAFADILR